MKISDAGRRVVELEDQLLVTSRVVAPSAGRVIEVKAPEGAFVAIGTPLVSVQTGAGGLEVFLYIPTEHGKQVKPGMTVQIEPATVKKEEYGTMLGRVASISEFPATAQGMTAVLQNGDLVRQFSRRGPVCGAGRTDAECRRARPLRLVVGRRAADHDYQRNAGRGRSHHSPAASDCSGDAAVGSDGRLAAMSSAAQVAGTASHPGMASATSLGLAG